MKKYVGIIILLFSIAVLLFLGQMSLLNSKYLECNVSANESESLVSERIEQEGLILAVEFDEQNLVYDYYANTFYYSLVEGSSSSFNPYVKVISDFENVDVVFVEGEMTEDGIENNQTIRMLAYTDEYYCWYNLKCTTLPMMNIKTQQGISEDYVRMEMELFDNEKGAVTRVVTSEGIIRVRGATSSSFPKTSFRMSLRMESVGENIRQNDVSLLGLRQDDDWILYAPYNDQEKVRNVFCTNLWTETCGCDNAEGVTTGLEYKYLELFINGEYYGLYALGYPIDEKLIGIDEKAEAGLYKKVDWTNERNFAAKESLLDGWGIEAFEVKTVDDMNVNSIYEKWELLLEYYQQFYENRHNSEQLTEMLDIDNAIDTYLFFNLIQGYDNTRKDLNKNMYYYITIKDESLKLLYIPWDMDLTWGNHYRESWEENLVYPYYVDPEENVLMKNGPLNQLLLNDASDVLEQVIDKYWYLRQNGWSDEHVEELLNFYEEDIYGSGAYRREIERWPECTQANPNDKLSIFKEYVSMRLQVLDSYYTELEAACNQEQCALELSGEYTYSVEPLGCEDLKLYLTMLKHADYNIHVEIRDESILQDEFLVQLFQENDILYENMMINKELDADVHIILQNKESKECVDDVYFTL